MTFQAGKCPDCGGELQLPDDRTTVKCMYCAVDVTVQDAIQLSRSRVDESTTASPVKDKPYQGCAAGCGGCGGLMLVFGLLVVVYNFIISGTFNNNDPGIVSGIVGMLGWGLILLVVGFIWYRTTPEKLVGFEANCPYCQTRVRMPPNNIGADCPACKKRIVFRDMRFFSVDTPIGTPRKAGAKGAK